MEFGSPFEYVIYAWACGLAFHGCLHFVVIVCSGAKIFNFWDGSDA